ncbi:MAG: transposase, partial [Qingshengfaniella sp.]
LGNPTGFHLTPGQACDLDGADVLIDEIDADILIADKGYDADQRVIDRLEAAGIIPVIPSKSNRKASRNYDKALYKT